MFPIGFVDFIPIHCNSMIAAIEPKRSLIVKMFVEWLARLPGCYDHRCFQRLSHIHDLPHRWANRCGKRGGKFIFAFIDGRSSARNWKWADIKNLIKGFPLPERMVKCYRMHCAPSPCFHLSAE